MLHRIAPRDRLPTHGAGNDCLAAAPRAAYSLTELMVVVVLLAIAASFVLSSWRPNQVESLEAAAKVVASDLAYVRGLAVAKGSSYQITWDVASDRYSVKRVAADSSLQPVPPPPTVTGSASKSEYIEDLARLPSGGCELIGVETTSTPKQSLEQFQFTPTGAVDPAQSIRVWLANGTGSSRRYLSVDVVPQTGIATIGELTAQAPILPASGSSMLSGGAGP